jgi:cell division transport system permease protein
MRDATAAKVTRRSAAAVERSRPRITERLAAWRDLHLYSLVSSIGRIASRPWATLLTVGVMAVALTLPVLLTLVLANLEQVSGSFRESREVSLFLQPDLSAEEVQAIHSAVLRLPEVEDLSVRSPAQGLEEFRQMADFAGALELLDYNPLPAVLVITPRTHSDAAALADGLRALPGADFVQHDAEWRSRLTGWLALAWRMILLAAGLLGAGVLLVVGNTVRLDIQGRAEEIRTVQLLGATDGFVRRPFLYLGACYGALAALLTLALALIAQLALQTPVASLVQDYGSEFQLRGLGWIDAAVVMLVAVLLGWLGAWLAAGHHLRQSLPERTR